MQKITPFLWFNNNAQEAIDFYLSVFKNGKVLQTMPGPGGTISGATFELEGQKFMVLNGGPVFSFTPAISLFVQCETQEEVDYYWEKLSTGGEEQNCGWLKDKFGLSWQIIPTALSKALTGSDPVQANKAMQAMLAMKKIDITTIEQAMRA